MATLHVNAAFKKQVNFRVPPELKERLDNYVGSARQSKADIAVQKSTRLLQTNPLKRGGGRMEFEGVRELVVHPNYIVSFTG